MQFDWSEYLRRMIANTGFSGVNRVKYLVIILGLLSASSTVAQICNDGIRQNAFLARYELSADPSVVTDLATGLQWQRCAVGYVFNDQGDGEDISISTCDDPDSSTQITWDWNQAIERAAQEGDGWRLPNNKELTSLIELACHTPAINTDAFPDTLQSGHWTSTPNATTDASAWSVSFGDGADAVTDKRSALTIRLVRDSL